ncbi:MAG: PDZ domain-containing protein [Planctomycetaceae bacterium]|nr:PDZ domain-containing protein [Planctomycetaceae bacterium]
MQRLILLLFGFGLAAVCRIALPAEQQPVGAPSDLADLVDRLDHSDFAVRENASRRLAEAGAAGISVLAEAAQIRSPETATRAMHVLEEHLRSNDHALFDAADDVLQGLADGDRGLVAVGAADILSRHSSLREERAIAAIRQLGGTVTFDRANASQNWWGPAPIRPDVESARRSLRPTSIVLRSDWQGGTDGLKFLRRLSHCRDLKLYVVRGSGVPLPEAQKLAAALPGLDVQERGALLGINNAPSLDPTDCAVGRVIADGPAGRAGIREGDTIRQLDGVPVRGFEDLIEKLKAYDAGKKISMTVDRMNANTKVPERLTVSVELGHWDLPELTEDAQNFLQRVQEFEAASRARQDRPEQQPTPADLIPERED